MKGKIRKSVIPVAGLGTRFLPASKSIPKELLPIVDKPTIQYIVEEAVASGAEHVILITGRGKGAIEDYFDISPELEDTLKSKGNEDLRQLIREISEMVHMVSIRQKEAKGLGHAVLCAQETVGEEPFAVLLGDDLVDSEPPCLAQMVQVWQKWGGGVVALQRVPKTETHLYGIILGEEIAQGVCRITELMEKPSANHAPSDLAIIGRYILPPEIFTILESTPAGTGGEIQLTDALQELARTQPLYGYEFSGKRYDAGDKFGYLQANIAFALKRPEMAKRLKEFLKKVM